MGRKKIFIFLLLLFMAIALNAAEPERPEESEEPEEPEEPETGEPVTEEPAVVKFNNLLSTKFSLGYSFLYFEETAAGYSSQTNRPLDFGIGIRIKNISMGFSFSIPFLYDKDYEQSPSFDISFNHYYKNRDFTSGYIKYYSGFHNDIDGDIALQIIDIGILHEYVFNKDHSLRSVYDLDEKQTKSNGSLLLGGGLFLTAIQSDTLVNYNKTRRTFHFGPNVGFSYTWVFESNCFINILYTLGTDLLILIDDNNGVGFGFQSLPRFSFGYHGKTWSANIYVIYSLLVGGFRTDREYNLLSGDIGLAFIKRFL